MRTIPRSWKLVCCYKLREYICDLANAKAAEKEEFEKENQDKPAKDAMLQDKGLSFDHCEYRYKTLQILVDLDNLDLLDESSEDEFGFGSDNTEDKESPVVYADQSVDQDDEPALIKWFAGWSIRNLDIYKRFVVVGTDPKSLSRLSRIKEVVDIEDAHTTKFSSAPEASPVKLTRSARDRAICMTKPKSVAAKYKKPSSPGVSIPQVARSSTTSVTILNDRPDQSDRHSNLDAQVMELIQTEANKQVKSIPQLDSARDNRSSRRSSINSRLKKPSSSRGLSITAREEFQGSHWKKSFVPIHIYPGRIYNSAGDGRSTSSGSSNSKISRSGIQTSGDG
jgi:hypothetical protein